MPVTMEEIKSLVRIQLGLDEVSPEDRFMEDLGAESADLVNIIAAAEDKFQVSLEEEEIYTVRTPRHLYDLLNRTAG
jgi:acyl carrier protein